MARVVRTRLASRGRITVPTELLSELGLNVGDEVFFALLPDGAVLMYTMDQAIETAHKLLEQYVPPGVSLVDELMRDRREEAAREELELGRFLS